MLTTFAAGPIPTSISKPSGCNDHFIVAADVGAVTSQVTTHWRMEFPKVNKYGSTCDPGSYVSAVQLTQNPVFSPGSACPTGYEPKCTFVPDDATIAANASSTLTRWPGLAHTDMAIGCCLTGYSCVVGASYSCVSSLTEGETKTGWMMSTYTDTSVLTADKSTFASVMALQLLYMTDAPSTLFATPTSSASNSASNSAGPGTSINNKNTENRPGLSAGAKAAIGVSVPLAVVVLLVALLFILRRRRRERTAPGVNMDWAKSELDGSDQVCGEMAKRAELPEGYHARSELDGYHRRAELPEGEAAARTGYTPAGISEMFELPASPVPLPPKWSTDKRAAAVGAWRGQRRSSLTRSQ